MVNGRHLYHAFLQTAVQLILIILPLTHKHTNTQTHKHTNTQTHKHTNTQTHKHTNTHTHTNSDWLPCKLPSSSSGAVRLGALLKDTSTCPDDCSCFLSRLALTNHPGDYGCDELPWQPLRPSWCHCALFHLPTISRTIHHLAWEDYTIKQDPMKGYEHRTDMLTFLGSTKNPSGCILYKL